MSTMTDTLNQANQLIAQLRKEYPGEINAFLHFMRKTEDGPALSHREEELINVALSVAAQCEWCIALHVKSAIEVGATRDEIMGAGFQAVLMHGGPALMHLVLLSEALDEFEAPATEEAPAPAESNRSQD